MSKSSKGGLSPSFILLSSSLLILLFNLLYHLACSFGDHWLISGVPFAKANIIKSFCCNSIATALPNPLALANQSQSEYSLLLYLALSSFLLPGPSGSSELKSGFSIVGLDGS